MKCCGASDRDALDVHRNPQLLIAAREPELTWQDANHRVRHIVERDRRSRAPAVSAEAAAPEALADQDDALGARPALAIGEVAPDPGLYAQHAQETDASRQGRGSVQARRRRRQVDLLAP